MMNTTMRAPFISRTITLALLLGAVVSLGLTSWPVADDFCNALRLRNTDPVAFTQGIYQIWSGRILSTYALAVAFKYFDLSHFNVISAGLGGIFLAASCLQARLVFSKSQIALGTVLFSGILWFGFKSSLSETVFWPTGGLVYVLPTAIGLFWLVLFKSKLDRDTKAWPWWTWIFFWLLSLVTGTGIEMLSPALIMIAGIGLVWKWKTPNTPRILLATAIGFLCLGTIAMVAAPGNFERAKHGKNSFKLGMSDLIAKYFEIAGIYLSLTHAVLLLSLGAGVIILVIKALRKNQDPEVLNRVSPDGLAASGAYCAGALASIVPMVFVSDFAFPRTTLVFAVCVSLAVVQLFNSINFAPKQWTSLSRLISARAIETSIPLVLAAVVAGAIISDALLARPIRHWFLDRHAYILDLKQNGATTIDVSSYKGPLPDSLPFHDVQRKKGYWVNMCVAEYYGIKGIFRGDKPVKPNWPWLFLLRTPTEFSDYIIRTPARNDDDYRYVWL